ncbi:nucleotidyltransferase family protein [Ottowia thiooxydans]|uniref:nucleotidyltransferase family protein n=1 Tax=Ottowia thiooxydans TaxID=219182 RepID=UPI000423C7E1|nr:nucleotidyltransferase family protein [Ottowia thiooxydans]
MPGKIGAIIMAAGAGRRMGGRPKSLLLRDSVPLIERQLRALAQIGVSHAVVVLGHHSVCIEPVLVALQSQFGDSLDLRWALNPLPDDGPGSSLRVGLAALSPELDAVLVTLADQPLVEAADMRAVLAGWEGRGPEVELVVPSFEGEPGHPVVFGAGVRDAVVAMSGGAGLRDWRKAHSAQVQMLPVDHARHTLDIDTEADRAALAERYGIALEWPAGLDAGVAASG